MTYIARNISESINTSGGEKKVNPNSGQPSFLDELSPKSAMFVGLVTSMLVVCSIGFVILLIAYFGVSK